MDIDPSEATEQGSKHVDSPTTLDIITGSPPLKDYQSKKRKFDSTEESGSLKATNPFSPVKLQSVGKEVVLKIESCFESWTETNSVARAMKVVGAATQLAKQVTYLGCVVCRASSERDQLEEENSLLKKVKAQLESGLKQKEDSLFVAEDQFRSLCSEHAETEKKLAAAEKEKEEKEKRIEGLENRIQGLEKQIAENKADADFSLFLGRVLMLKDITVDKATFVPADQLATLRKEFPQHADDIEEVFGPDQPADSKTATRESRTVGQRATGLVAEDPLAAIEQEAHSNP